MTLNKQLSFFISFIFSREDKNSQNGFEVNIDAIKRVAVINFMLREQTREVCFEILLQAGN